jgi:uncharacterized integral membrane protein
MSNVMETRHEQSAGRRATLSVGVVFGVIVTVAVAALIAQNTSNVSVHWLTLDGQQPLWAVLAITVIAGVLLTRLFGFVWRHRDRKA